MLQCNPGILKNTALQSPRRGYHCYACQNTSKHPKKNGHTYMKFVRLCSVARACNRWRLKQALSRILKKIEIWISKDILKHLGRVAKPGDSGIVFVAKPSKQELKRLLRSAPLRLEDIATCDLPFVNTKKKRMSQKPKKTVKVRT